MSGRFPVSINQLNTTVGALVDSDAIGVFKQSQGETVREPLEDVKTYMQNGLDFEANQFSTAYTIQNEVPTSGDTIIVDAGTPAVNNVYVTLQSTALLTSLIITFPDVGDLVEGQEFVFATGFVIRDVSFNLGGASMVGNIADSGPYDFKEMSATRFRFNKASETWFRIG